MREALNAYHSDILTVVGRRAFECQQAETRLLRERAAQIVQSASPSDPSEFLCDVLPGFWAQVVACSPDCHPCRKKKLRSRLTSISAVFTLRHTKFVSTN